MKVKDLLELIDEDEIVEVDEQEAPINKMSLFAAGSARRLSEHTDICNATVTGIAAVHDVLYILVSRKEPSDA